jgi:hypothetical protein
MRKVSILEQLPDFFNWSLEGNTHRSENQLLAISFAPIVFIVEKGV